MNDINFRKNNWLILGLLAIIALGLRVFANTSFVQASEHTQSIIQETPAYPPPILDGNENNESSSSDISYPAPFSLPNDIPLVAERDITTLTYKNMLPIIFGQNYNCQAAVEYADTWAHARNTSFPNYGSIGDCTDCTNYLSQMLWAGGHTMIGLGNDPTNTYNWWAFCIVGGCSNSLTWSATDWINIYI